MEVKDKHILITGGASGIGLALVKQLLDAGAYVFSVDIHKTDISHERLYYYICDLSDHKGVQESFDQAINIMGSIDVYIANAGQARYGYTKDMKDTDQKFLFDLNIFAPIYALDLMVNHHKKGPFTFLVTSSAMAYWPLPGYASYAATKAAIKNYIKAYRYELNKDQKLILVYPVATKTNFFNTSGQSHPSWMIQTPEHVAKSMIKGIRKGKKDIYPSRLFRLIHAFFPCLLKPYINREKKLLKDMDH